MLVVAHQRRHRAHRGHTRVCTRVCTRGAGVTGAIGTRLLRIVYCRCRGSDPTPTFLFEELGQRRHVAQRRVPEVWPVHRHTFQITQSSQANANTTPRTCSTQATAACVG